jgi:hypothetical protein
MLNDTLIPPQTPGAASGAVYTWLDEAIDRDVTYYYRLEDLDVSGRRGVYGPVSCTVGVTVAEWRVFLPVVRRSP